MSQHEPVKHKIGDASYEMYPLPPDLSMDLLTDLTAVIAPIVAPVLSSIFSGKSDVEKSDIMDKEISPDMFSKALISVNSKELKAVRKDLVINFAKVTHREGTLLDGTVEAVFLGNIGEMLQWLVWGCQVQWGKSLSGLMKGQLSKVASLIPQGSQSPST